MTKSKNPSRFFVNAIANWGAFLFVAIVSFFLSPFIVQHLGATAYGVWSLLVALVGYLGLLDFGVRGAVTRYVAHHYAVDDNEACSSIVTAGLVMFGILGLLAILLSGVFAYFSPTLFNIPETLVLEARIALILGGLTVATTLIGAVFAGVVTGLERFDISSGVEVGVTAIRTIAVVIALNAGYGLVALGYIHLAASVLYGVAAWTTVRRIYPALRLKLRGSLMPHIKTIVSFSAFLSLIHVFGLLIYYSNALIIAAFLPIAAVTFFAIAGNLIDYASKVASALSKMMTPRVSALTSVGSKDISQEIVSAARIATLATAPIAVTFWFRGESFVSLWMGQEYGPISGEILRILSLMVFLGGARGIAIASIIGMNRHRALIPGLAFEAISNIALSIALVRPFGVSGVAIGALIPSILVGVGFIPRCLAKATGISLATFFRSAWLLPFLACVPFAVTSALVEKYYPAANLAVFFLQVAVLLALVPAAAWFLCLTPVERQQVRFSIVKRINLQRRLSASRRVTLKAVRAVIEPVEEYFFVVLFYYFVRPVARFLPVPFGKRIYAVVSQVLAYLSFHGRDIASDYVSAYGSAPAQGWRIAQKKLYWSIWEYAVHIRSTYRPLSYRVCECSQINRSALEKILSTNKSFIVAMGHFARDEPGCWALDSTVLPLSVVQLLGPIPPIELQHPHLMNNRVHLRAMEGLLRVLHEGEIDLAMVGEESASGAKLIRRLKTTRCALVMYVDPPWNPAKHRSAIVRPFAATERSPFAVGAARMARATGCPILLCIPERIDDDHCRLVWHDPIWVADNGGQDADVSTTNSLLDVIERCIGRSPERYILPIGEGRRWNSALDCWEEK